LKSTGGEFLLEAAGPGFEALLRGALANKLSSRLIREFFSVQIVRRLAKELGGVIDPREVPLRATFVASQLFRLASTRYILKLKPLASAPPGTIVAVVGPTVQRYLTGDLPDSQGQ
jgi:hypothetical protein